MSSCTRTMTVSLESLPVELIADIMSELDIESIIKLSYLSRRLHAVASNPSLNPWRPPILRNLRSPHGTYERCMKHLAVRSTVPRSNWIDILSLARPRTVLFESTLPNLRDLEWEECFKRRFLPGWVKWKKDGSWKEVFLKLLYRVWHRSQTTCRTDEAWIKLVLLNRNGSANQLEVSARNYNPLTLFNDLKIQNNLAHVETRVRSVVEFADVRILAFGTLHRPRSSFMVNPNARELLHPRGIDDYDRRSGSTDRIPDYVRLTYPAPSVSHAKYPFFTPGGWDKRWIVCDGVEEEGLEWVGTLMLTTQIVGPRTRERFTEGPMGRDLDLVVGPGHQQYGSFGWSDLWAIAPWMEGKISKCVDGMGLGH